MKITKQIIIRLVTFIFLLLIVWFILNKMFPKNIDVEPVLDDSTEIKKDAERLNKKVLEDEDIKTISPIPIIPIVPIVLQSFGQSTDNDFKGAGESNTSEYQGYIQTKPNIYQDTEEPRATWEEPEETKRYSPQALNCDEFMATYCNIFPECCAILSPARSY